MVECKIATETRFRLTKQGQLITGTHRAQTVRHTRPLTTLYQILTVTLHLKKIDSDLLVLFKTSQSHDYSCAI